MFKVEKHNIGRFEAMRLINDTTGEYLEVLNEFGAGINDLTFVNKTGDLISVVDGYRSEHQILHEHHVRFKGSKLSPFPNRITNGKYDFQGKSHQLPVNEVGPNNNLHAFLHNKPFLCIEESADQQSASLTLNYHYKGTEQGYPFAYELRLSYVLKGGEVTINTEITNTGNEDMPVGDGWHPYFYFANINTTEMQMDSAERKTSNVGNEPSAIHGFEELNTIGAQELDDCFEAKDNGQFNLRLLDKDRQIDLGWWQESAVGKYRYLQIYTPPHRTSVAIEPVTCMPNAFNTGQGLIILKPNETVSMSFGIKNLLQTN